MLRIGFLRFNPFWKPLEKYNASEILPKLMGQKAYRMIWEPLFINKFGKFAGIFLWPGFGPESKKELRLLLIPKEDFWSLPKP